MTFGRFPALKYRDFRLWSSGQFISLIGTQMQIVAVNWHIYLLTHSALALGLIGLLRFVPIVLASLVAGVIADKYNRKMLNLILQIVLALLSFVLAVLTFTHRIDVLAIYTITFLTAIAGSFENPTRQALLPDLVKEREYLQSALSLNVLLHQGSMVLGPALCGFLIASWGVAPIYLINTISFVAVIIALLFIHATGAVRGEIPTFSFESFKDGVSFVFTHTVLWSTMVLDFACTFFAEAMTLLPIFAKDILRVGPRELGLLYAAPSIGAVVAGYILTHVGPMKRQGKILIYSVTLYALATIVFGFSRIFLISFLALFFVGFGDSISAVIRNTVRQMTTPHHLLGRMTSINMIFFMGGPQLGVFEAGLVASLIGAPLSVVTGGIGALFVVAIMAYKLPVLRRYDG